jgi:hypothetical protein
MLLAVEFALIPVAWAIRTSCKRALETVSTAEKLELTHGDFEALMASQVQGWQKLEAPFTVKINGVKLTAKYLIGHSSSLVFLDPERNTIIKITPVGDSERRIEYEQLVTQYLLENHVSVPRILGTTQIVLRPKFWAGFNGGFPSSWNSISIRSHAVEFSVLAKEYRRGVLHDQLFQPIWQTFQLDNAKLGKRLSQALAQKQTEIKKLFIDGGFRTWVREYGLVGYLLPQNLVKGGDLDNSNFMLTWDDGWSLYDP